MNSLKMKIIIIFLSLFFLQSQSKALDLTSGEYNIPNDLHGNIVLNTFNEVKVNMFGDNVAYFNMYDNSQLTIYNGSINYLYLYSDSDAILYGGNIARIWADPSSNSSIKLYANIEHIDPFPNSQGQIGIISSWLSNNQSFYIDLIDGSQTINHVQFIPEPASLLLMSFGALSLLQSKK